MSTRQRRAPRQQPKDVGPAASGGGSRRTLLPLLLALLAGGAAVLLLPWGRLLDLAAPPPPLHTARGSGGGGGGSGSSGGDGGDMASVGRAAAEGRLARARELLAVAVAAGAILHVPLSIEQVDPAAGELGVFVQQAVAPGSPIVSLPGELMLHPALAEEAAATAAGAASPGHGLGVALLRERRQPRTELIRLWIDSLPVSCPQNIAARPAADRALAAASMHAWKVELLERELATMQVAARKSSVGNTARVWLLH